MKIEKKVKYLGSSSIFRDNKNGNMYIYFDGKIYRAKLSKLSNRL